MMSIKIYDLVFVILSLTILIIIYDLVCFSLPVSNLQNTNVLGFLDVVNLFLSTLLAYVHKTLKINEFKAFIETKKAWDFRASM